MARGYGFLILHYGAFDGVVLSAVALFRGARLTFTQMPLFVLLWSSTTISISQLLTCTI